MKILGISAYYHDSAASLIINGDIVSAAQEERFSRKKHDESFPVNAIKYCLKEAGIGAYDLNYIVFYDKPFLKFERILETYLAFAPAGYKSFASSLPIWVKEKLFQKKMIVDSFTSEFGKGVDWRSKLLFSEHHLSHAASAFFPSPFNDAAVLTMDGVGEWTTTSLSIGCGNKLTVQKEINFPHSLGLLYSAFTYHAGFKVNSGEYKLMGLAPYGRPRFLNQIKDNIIDIKEDGSFNLDMSYFNFCTGLTMTNDKFSALFEGTARKSEGMLGQREMDLAASVQAVTEEIVLKLAKNIRKSTGQKNLCLAGGVALNCVVNGKLLREGIFDKIWIQPASGDAGGAVGAALCVNYLMLNQPRTVLVGDSMKGSYLGPLYSQIDIEKRLKMAGAVFTVLTADEMINKTAQALADGNAVGWFQGRMEFGPRALGGRSILADPRAPTVQKQLNLKVKYRESFRPFAPSVLFEKVHDWFDLDTESPYMLIVTDIKEKKRNPMTDQEKSLFGIELLNIPRSEIPAVTHVDYSARIQTVHSNTNPLYHQLITKFYELTGCPVVVNTSFNVRGEPIVNTPEDAFNCLMGTELDFLAIGNCILSKESQCKNSIVNYKNKFNPD
jgi:carbamoyltransferase